MQVRLDGERFPLQLLSASASRLPSLVASVARTAIFGVVATVSLPSGLSFATEPKLSVAKGAEALEIYPAEESEFHAEVSPKKPQAEGVSDEVPASQAAVSASVGDLAAIETSEKGGAPLMSEWRLVPAPFFTPETSLGTAIVLGHLFRFNDYPRARVSHNLTSFALTFNKQFRLENRGQVFLQGEDWTIFHVIQGRLWPERFFGIGNQPDTSSFESYENRSFDAIVQVAGRINRSLYAGPMFEAHWSAPFGYQGGGRLQPLTVPGSRSYLVAGVGGVINWDTRNSGMNPTQGSFYGANAVYFPKNGADGFEYGKVDIDLRRYQELAEGHVVAARFYSTLGVGDIPFTQMPVLGGEQRLRGIFETWIRDKNVAYGVAEYRWNFWWRFGVVGFLGLGQARPSIADFTLDGMHVAGGAGLRFTVLKEERINLRLDTAMSDFGSLETYISIGEAF